MTISTSTATTYFSDWTSRVRLIRSPGMRMVLASIEEVDGYKFGNITLWQIRPNGLDIGIPFSFAPAASRSPSPVHSSSDLRDHQKDRLPSPRPAAPGP